MENTRNDLNHYNAASSSSSLSSTSSKTKRVMTPAIPGMKMTDVRNMLRIIRSKIMHCFSNNQPLYITDRIHSLNSKIQTDMTIQDFCMHFIIGQHNKRHNKGKKQKKIDEEEDE